MAVSDCCDIKTRTVDLLGAGHGASRGGHARAGAGTLDGERTKVVDLVTLLDLESVVVAVGQGSRGGPDELAVASVGGQSLDILEVVGRTLAQDDGHRLSGISRLFAPSASRVEYSRWWCRWSHR